VRRRRRRAGFIVVFGWRVICTRERKSQVRGRCPNCRVEDARLIGKMRRPWFTLFFIPVFPLASKSQSHRISQCRECKDLFDMPIEQFARRAGAAARNTFADTILLYNQLRDRPGDGKTMLKLLKMYEAMGEASEAEIAARHFPNAVAADPACAKLLEKMRQASGGRVGQGA
jgi:hypothetical protein